MAMETLSEAITRLEHAGYTESVAAHDDGKLHCSGCRSTCEPDHVTIDDVVRFEGDSNPDDEAVLFALDCGQHKSLYSIAFGPETPPNDVAAVRALSRRARDRLGRRHRSRHRRSANYPWSLRVTQLISASGLRR